jgi:hypothetical protein
LRGEILPERDEALRERDEVLPERDETLRERDEVPSKRDGDRARFAVVLERLPEDRGVLPAEPGKCRKDGRGLRRGIASPLDSNGVGLDDTPRKSQIPRR